MALAHEGLEGPVKRAKQPPSAELVGEASIVADAIALGRRLEIDEKLRDYMVINAMREYLRRFPKARKMNSEPWVEMPVDGEIDFQCLFCRKSLNTLPMAKTIRASFIRPIREHCEECAIRMLAGLMEPHEPLPHGEPGL